MRGTFSYLDKVNGQILVEPVFNVNFLPGFDRDPLVHRVVLAPPLVNVLRMHGAFALATGLCIAMAIALLLGACLRLVRLPVMHEEQPSNAAVTVIRITTAAVGFLLEVAFTLTTVLRIALCSAFCTDCWCIPTQRTASSFAPFCLPVCSTFLFFNASDSKSHNNTCRNYFYVSEQTNIPTWSLFPLP